MRRLTALLSVVLTTFACGGSRSPTSPSLATTGATITGSVVAPGTTMVAPVARTSALGAAGSNLTVSVVGTTVTSAVDSSNHFFLRNVPDGDVQLQFSGAGVDARVSVTGVQGAEEIALTISLTGLSAEIDTMSRHAGDAEQVEGRVESLPPTVPAGRFVVAERTVRTDASTQFFRNGAAATFADLAIGVRVHVTGLSDATSLLASVVEIQNINADLPVLINGVVKEFSGPLSGFQFKVDNRLIKGDALTEFFGNSVFADLANDKAVEVKGLQRDGFVYAARIHVNVEDAGGSDQSASIEGVLKSKTGVPPVLLVGDTTVRTSAATVVQRRGDTQDLSVLQLGMTLHVVGTRRSDGSIDARLIQIKDDDVDSVVEIEGSMGGVKGTCPSIQFGVNGYSIATDASTVFTPACSTFKSGTKAKVKGTRQSDGSVKATSVSAQ